MGIDSRCADSDSGGAIDSGAAMDVTAAAGAAAARTVLSAVSVSEPRRVAPAVCSGCGSRAGEGGTPRARRGDVSELAVPPCRSTVSRLVWRRE